MNLTAEQVETANQLIAKLDISLPSYRREISSSGKNYQWLQKALRKHDIPNELKQLLAIEK